MLREGAGRPATTWRSVLEPSGVLSRVLSVPITGKSVNRQNRKNKQNQLLFHRCSLLTWWLQRSGCTRSHSELGRETLQRQWYFVSRRGRVGRCQVCQAQHEIKTQQFHTKHPKGRSKRPFAFANTTDLENQQSILQIIGRKSIITNLPSGRQSGNSRSSAGQSPRTNNKRTAYLPHLVARGGAAR